MNLQLQIHTLTPLWTGGVQTGRMDRIHASGIIGSLRWWYEAIVRGLGGEVCDPTSATCHFDEKAYEKARQQGKTDAEALRVAGLCAVCQVFGATGWKRRFRFRLRLPIDEIDEIDDRIQAAWQRPPDMLNVRPPDRSRGWFLPPGYVGDLALTISGDQSTCKQLAALFLFLEQWGNIGAKPQLGYGLFRLENRTKLLQLVHKQDDVWQSGTTAHQDNLPDLRRFGFFRFRFQPERLDWWSYIDGLERLMGQRDTAQAVQALLRQHTVPVMPAFKNAWRFHQWQGPFRVEKDLFGTVDRNERIRSKVAISWAYQRQDVWEIRGWAWLPQPNDAYAQQLWQIICNAEVWREILKVQQGVLETWPDTPEFATRSPAAVQDWVTVSHD
jgi:CRISPR-associated protein Cmr1